MLPLFSRGIQAALLLRETLPTSAAALQAFAAFLHTKKQANDVRPGNIIEVNGRLMQVVKQNHSQGNARQIGNVQFELRDVLNKSKHPLRLRPSDMVDVVRLDERNFQFLYQEGDACHCMDPSTFEQVIVPRDIFGTAADFLVESAEVTLSFHEGEPVGGALPPTVTLRVTQAAPHIKGETHAPQYKPAVLETGATVYVPPFVITGDSLVVDTATGVFVRRATL